MILWNNETKGKKTASWRSPHLMTGLFYISGNKRLIFQLYRRIQFLSKRCPHEEAIPVPVKRTGFCILAFTDYFIPWGISSCNDSVLFIWQCSQVFPSRNIYIAEKFLD